MRVRGRNGAFDLQAPFHIEVTLQTGECANVAPLTTPSSLQAAAGNYKTIILTDWSRLPGTVTDTLTLQDRLATFAARPEVAGVIVDVGTDNRVAAANAQADTYPACPYAKNLVAGAIKDIVDRYRALNPLEYVVLIGDDNVIPFFRSPDQAMLGNELNYSPPVRDNTSSQASLKLSYVLSQDRYGELLDLSSKGNALPLPGLAVGRLVETAAEATHMLDVYLNTIGGVVPTPTSSLVTGYDFLADAATAISGELQSGIGVAPDALIAPNNISPQDPRSWTATDLSNQLLGSRHDLIFLAGHFSANSALAADYSTRLLTSAVVSSSVNLENAIIYSAGCHAGYNIVDAHDVPYVTREPDWAQTFARKGATLIAGTGYQYGDTDFIEYSERLYLDFTQQLRLGTGPVAIGKALVAAKQQYLADTPVMRPIHEKAVLEATLFGLPMLSVNLPGRTTPSSDTSIVPSTSPFSVNPGATLGLSYADLNVIPSLTRHDDVLNVVSSTQTVSATYFSGTNGVVVNPVEPILPLELRNVSGPNGLVLRGVGFRGGSYTDLANILPRTGAATTEIRGVHPAFVSNVFYPIVPWRINYLDALFGGSTHLVATPAQYLSSDPNSTTGTMRTYNNMQFRLFYSNNTSSYANSSTPALAAAPYIVQVADTVNSTNVVISVIAIGNPAAGIQGVWATYTADSGPYAGQWQSLDLTRDPLDSTLWQGVLPLNGTNPQAIHYMVQAVNGVGLVSLSTNLGAHYTPGSVTPNRAPTSLTLTAAAPSGPYGTEASFSAVLISNGAPLAGQTIVFGLGSQRLQGITDNTGTATVSIPLLGLPNDYVVRASFRGTTTHLLSSAETDFTITKQATHITLTPPQPSGLPETNSLLVATLADATGRPLGEKIIFFVVSGPGGSFSTAEIADYAGRAVLGDVPLLHGTYTVQAYFSGAILLSTGETVTLEDDRYLPSNATTTLNVLDHAPNAVNDIYGVEENDTLNVSAPGVLSNDTDVDGDPLTASLDSGPAHGTLTLNADGSFVYTPTTNYVGTDSFTYKASDGFGGSDTALVTITVHAINQPPDCSSVLANPISIWPPNGTFYPVTVQGVTDPDNDPVSITITGIFQDEPTGNNWPDAHILGPDRLPYLADVRAERLGGGDGRVYHLFFTASDGMGGTCSGQVRTAIVSHDQSNIDAIDQGPLYNSLTGP